MQPERAAPPAGPSLLRAIGRWSLVAAIVNGVIGSGIFGLPSLVAGLAGVWSPALVLAAGAAIVGIGLCFAEVGSRFDEAGGPYLYTREAFGPAVGFQVGWLLLVGRLLSAAAALNVLIAYLAPLIPSAAAPAGRAAVMIGAVASITAVNIRGVRMATWTTNVFTVGKLTPLAILIALGVFRIDPAVLSTQVTARPDWREALLLLIFAYGGFEAMIVAAGEGRDPRRDTPVALLVAIVAVTGIYAALQLVVIGVLPRAAGSATPIGDALAQLLGPGGTVLASVAVVLSVSGWLTGFTLMMPRVLYAMARRGELPAALGRVHPRFRTPHVAVLVNAAVALAFGLTSSFAQAASLAAVARLAVFLVTCATVIPFRRRGGGPPAAFRLRGGEGLSVVAMLFCLWLLGTRSPAQLALLAGSIAIGAVVQVAYRRHAPATEPAV